MSLLTRSTRLLAVAALIPLGACSLFQVKPLEPSAEPATRPAGGAQPAPATPPTGQPAVQGQTPPRTTPPAGTPPAATPAGGAPAAATPAPGAATPGAATPAPGAATPAPGAATGRQALSPAQMEAERAKRDSARLAEAMAPKRRSPVYLPLMIDIHSARLRTAKTGVDQGEEEVSGSSIELALQRARGAGIGLAIRGIGLGTGAPEYAEAALLMGSRKFALDLGAATRTGFDSLTFSGGGLNDSTYIFARAGFRSRANLGNTDFSVQFRGLYYIGLPSLDDAFPDSELEGWSGETGLSWSWSRFPLTVNLGYRIERFLVWDLEQETSSFVIGGGILLGRR